MPPACTGSKILKEARKLDTVDNNHNHRANDSLQRGRALPAGMSAAKKGDLELARRAAFSDQAFVLQQPTSHVTSWDWPLLPQPQPSCGLTKQSGIVLLF